MAESNARALSRLLSVLLAAAATRAIAQGPASLTGELAPRPLPMASIGEFRPTSSNWTIAGGASANRATPMTLLSSPGTGVVVNVPRQDARGHLLTTWEHGDIDLSFDVMLPKGSNSGVYLMGRYELQLFDSWGVRAPSFADLGGIYQRWDDARRAGFDGTAPRVNASRAPGLWQHVDLSFRAPKFSGARKMANARFARVVVNGVVVHENVEVTGPTQSAAFQDERAMGPLMFQGDHGPVALRNLTYKSYAGTVAVSGLRYRAFQGDAMDASFAATHMPVHEGDATSISPEHAGVNDRFAVSYDGTLTAPTAGLYRFQLTLGWIGSDSATRGAAIGGGRLAIDGALVISHDGADRRMTADVQLAAGKHAFALTYYKNRASFNRRDVSLFVEGPGVERRALHEELGGSVPINPIVVDVQREPVLLRGFIRHGDTKRVIAIAVADPAGVHYSYDLAQGALLHVWRGPFLETTQMWHERGESQTAEPMGSVVTLAGTPTVAIVADANAAWPDSVIDDRQLRRDGYSLDRSGHPTFLFRVGSVSVEDRMLPAADGASLRRELHFRAPSAAPDGTYVQLARAERITRESDGSFVVGDRSYYVVPGDGPAPLVRRFGDRDELMLPVRFERGEAVVSYTIVW